MHGLYCSYGGFFAEPAAATAGFGPPEDEEEYARRIWQEMEKRKRQQSGSAASAARTYFAAETQAKSAREQAAFDAAQRSRQILEEEKAKDRAWREAVQKVLRVIKYLCTMYAPALFSMHVKAASQFRACSTASLSVVMVLCNWWGERNDHHPTRTTLGSLRSSRCLACLVTPSGVSVC